MFLWSAKVIFVSPPDLCGSPHLLCHQHEARCSIRHSVLVNFTPWVPTWPPAHSPMPIVASTSLQIPRNLPSTGLPLPSQNAQVLRVHMRPIRSNLFPAVHITHLNSQPLAGSNYPRASSPCGRKFIASCRALASCTLTSSLEVQFFLPVSQSETLT